MLEKPSLEPKLVINGIRADIEASKGTRIWGDYVSALKLISQVVFTRSSGFLLEFVQNAEDAGMGLTSKGTFKISLNKERIRIDHNGRPFNEANVRAVCGISPSKKPERGTLGYLGIGFKSVFKVTDAPEIYSSGYNFKFDRNHPGWTDQNNTPWHVLPVWIDNPSEQIGPDTTTFIIPLREKNYYESLVKELKSLRTELYLFLHWLKRIEVKDEVTNEEWVLEDLGEDEKGITHLRQGTQEQRFRFFRKEVPVNESVKSDRLTQEYRSGVTKREIAIAFAVDNGGSLAPTEAGAMYGGVYSFLPLGEASSGVKFPIQADFLVQPGRDAINYEAAWNHWILREVAELCKEAIREFKVHPLWKYQYLAAFEFSNASGLESVDRLFGPELVAPLQKFLEEEESIPTTDGSFAKPSMVLKVNEDARAIEDMKNFIALDQFGKAFVGQDGMKLVHENFIDRPSRPVRTVNRHDLLGNDEFLDVQRQKPNAADWFRELYLWLNRHPTYDGYGRKRKLRGYHDWPVVLTSECEREKGGGVRFPDLPAGDPFFQDLANALTKSGKVIHPGIISGVRDAAEQQELRGFLTGLTGVQLLNAATVCTEVILPRILTKSPKPTSSDLVKFTKYCRDILGTQIPYQTEIWVISDDGTIRAAHETLLPKVFAPEADWETNREYLPGAHFVAKSYLTSEIQEDRSAWQDFFLKVGVKGNPDNGVEDFGVNYAKAKLRLGEITQVEKRNFGYDLEATVKDGTVNRVEVKGQGVDAEIELTGNETDAADTHRSNYYVCIVSGIPESPEIYLVKDPSEPGVGKKNKLTIPISVWKSYRYFATE